MQESPFQTLIEELAEKPSDTFGMKRKLIEKYQKELSENNSQTHDSVQKKVKIEIYNMMSQIPQIVTNYVDQHASYKIINAMRDIDLSLQPYLDCFSHNDLSKHILYQNILHYLQVVHNNRQLYKQYKKQARELLHYFHPNLKVENPELYTLQTKLTHGIITFVLPDKLMQQFNIHHEDILLGQQGEHYTQKIFQGGGLGRYLYVIVSENIHAQDTLIKNIFGSEATGVIDHELQHIFNKFYLAEESCYHGIKRTLYQKAKDEIIAQFKTSKKPGVIFLNMNRKPYDYFEQKKANRITTVPNQIHKTQNRIQDLKSKQSSKILIDEQKVMLKQNLIDQEILSSSEKIEALRQEYYTNLQKYIEEAGIFINSCLDTGKISDPYLILAITPIDQWKKLAELMK